MPHFLGTTFRDEGYKPKLCSGLITPHQPLTAAGFKSILQMHEPSTCPQEQNETQIKKIHVLALRLQSATGVRLALGCCL